MKRLLILLALLASAAAAQVAVSLSPMPRLQFFDSNGAPCSGCLLYSYAAGTSTAQATYIDSTGLYPNANPIVLDSMGSASVWLSSAAYKLVLTTASGSTIFSVDNIRGNDSTYLRLDGTNSPLTGAVTFNAGVTLSAGGTFGGTFAGTPTISGQWSFTGAPLFTSLSFGQATSETSSPAQSGLLRLAASDQMCWRNAAGSADICVAKNGEDQVSAPSFASQTANAAESGILALASTDKAPCWRNDAGTADNCLGHDSNDNLTYNGNVIAGPTASTFLRYSDTVSASVTNTTSPTTLQSVTYNAGDINSVGRSLHVSTALQISNSTGNSQQITVELYVGTTQMLNEGVTDAAGTVDVELDWWGAVSGAGASGTIATGFFGGTATQTLVGNNAGSPTAIDTTSSQAVSIKVILPTASTSLSVTQPFMVLTIQ